MRPRYFYSRASARRDCAGTGWDKIRCISTHAPLRGATRSKISHYRDWSISTHAPLRGATFLPAMRLFIRSNFYSRASARRDWRFVWLFLSCCISTHAPLRGATERPAGPRAKKSGFLLTRLCEARQLPSAFTFRSLTFLLTRLCEARLKGLTGHKVVVVDFYSRASARRDVISYDLTYTDDISTHAPLRGATGFAVADHRGHAISTHAPLRGATLRDRYFPTNDAFLLTRLCEARPLHLVPNGSRISIYRKRRTFFRKSTMIKHFSYPNYILFQANLPPFSQHFRFAAATLPVGKTPLALKNNYPL